MLLLAFSIGAPSGLAVRRRPCRASLQPAAHRVRRAHIFWDLDNIHPKDCEHVLVVGHRLRKAVQRITALQPDRIALRGFGNETTVGRLREGKGLSSESFEAVLELLGADVVEAGLGKDAADLLMRRDMLMFAEEHGPEAGIVCVSNDQGYAPALARCGRMGAFTVAVGAYCRNAGMNWGKPPADLPIPSVANCIVAWHPGKAPSEQAQQELRMVEQWQQRIGAAQRHLKKRHKGFCRGRWLNPNIPLAHTGVVAAAEPPQNVRQ